VPLATGLERGGDDVKRAVAPRPEENAVTQVSLARPGPTEGGVVCTGVPAAAALAHVALHRLGHGVDPRLSRQRPFRSLPFVSALSLFALSRITQGIEGGFVFTAVPTQRGLAWFAASPASTYCHYSPLYHPPILAARLCLPTILIDRVEIQDDGLILRDCCR
jgi:hypothetical protein